MPDKAHTGFEHPCKSTYFSDEVCTGVCTVRARVCRSDTKSPTLQAASGAVRKTCVHWVRGRSEGTVGLPRRARHGPTRATGCGELAANAHGLRRRRRRAGGRAPPRRPDDVRARETAV